jgi:hypothetical protein
MDSTNASGYVVPLPRIPKVIGILNIVFGAGLVACGLCSGMYAAMTPTIMKAMSQVTKKAEDDLKGQMKAQLDTLAEEETKAETDEEKAKIAAKRQEIANELKRPVLIPTMDFSKMGMDDPKFMAYWWADVVTSLVLNVLMLLSGIALVRFKPVGIKLALWVAGLKIARLIAVYGYFVLAIVPVLSQKIGQVVIEMLQQQQATLGKPMPPGMDTGMFVRVYSIMYSISGIAMIVLGSIYPIVCLWLLSRPGARAACTASKELEKRGEAW